MRRRLPHITLALAILLGACASAPLARPETVTFAPQLGVSLTAMQRLPSGVYYRDIREGDGAVVRAGDQIGVYFVGWLADGTQIDALTMPDPPVAFQLGKGQVIRGWDQGIEGMRVHGQRMLAIPAAAAYGRQSTKKVPGNSVLVFIIELVRVW